MPTINNRPIDYIVKYRIAQAISVLDKKGKGYAHQGNRYFNFFKGADIMNEYPEQTLMGYMVKHTTSVIQLLDDSVKHSHSFKIDIHDLLIDEKVGDQFNYLFILLAMLNRSQDIGSFLKGENLVKNITKAVEENLDEMNLIDLEDIISDLNNKITQYYQKHNWYSITLEDLITSVWDKIEYTMTYEIILRKGRIDNGD